MRSLLVALLGLSAGACWGGSIPADSACRSLPYGDGGVVRDAFLPCAGEMMAVLDRLAERTDAASQGDGAARTEGRTELGRLEALLTAAGGRQLLERWNDRAVTSLNVDINNAVTHYRAFYMLPVFDEPHPYAAKSREAAGSEARAARRRYEEARRLYRQLSPGRSARNER
jgi:hypothetical protein